MSSAVVDSSSDLVDDTVTKTDKLHLVTDSTAVASGDSVRTVGKTSSDSEQVVSSSTNDKSNGVQHSEVTPGDALNVSGSSVASKTKRRTSKRQRRKPLALYCSMSSESDDGRKSRPLVASHQTPLMLYNMSPETSLIEFISTSAAFHGVRRTSIRDLEDDLLTVFPDNIMPANAAAWYMAKKRYYGLPNGANAQNQGGNRFSASSSKEGNQYQLLTALLHSYPHKFNVTGHFVKFLEKYSPEVARKKLSGLIHQGLMAYFAHKCDEYGVYFFDPYYYETTEPFISNLTHTSSSASVGVRTKPRELIKRYFADNRDMFVFKPLSPYLVAISKQPLNPKVKVNVTCVITAVVVGANGAKYGVLKFASTDALSVEETAGAVSDGKIDRRKQRKNKAASSGNKTEKALFPLKALYRDGFVYAGDPLKLSAVEFDGYRIPARSQSSSKKSEWARSALSREKMNKDETEMSSCTWFAVLVWCGRKPSPRFCANKEDLTSGLGHEYSSLHIDAEYVGRYNSSSSSGARSKQPFSVSSTAANVSHQTEMVSGKLGDISPATHGPSLARSVAAVTAVAHHHEGGSTLFAAPQQQPLFAENVLIGQVSKIMHGGAVVTVDMDLPDRLISSKKAQTAAMRRQKSEDTVEEAARVAGDQSSGSQITDQQLNVGVHSTSHTPTKSDHRSSSANVSIDSGVKEDDGVKDVHREHDAKSSAGGQEQQRSRDKTALQHQFFLPGWMYHHVEKKRRAFLTTRQGAELSERDAVAFQVEWGGAANHDSSPVKHSRRGSQILENQQQLPEYAGFGYNVVVLRRGNPLGRILKLREERANMKTAEAHHQPSPSKVAKKAKERPLPWFLRFLLEEELAASSVDSDNDSSFDPAIAFDAAEFGAEFDECSDSNVDEEEVEGLRTDKVTMDEQALIKLATEMNEIGGRKHNRWQRKVAPDHTRQETLQDESQIAVSDLSRQVDKLIETVGGMTLSGQKSGEQI